VAGFARQAVAACGPPSPVRARSLLWACARLGSFGEGVGLEPVPEVLLHPSVIERFVMAGLGEAPETRRRTVRTNLRHVARYAAPAMSAPGPPPLARQRAKAPYSPAEIAAFLALADAQPTAGRRHRLGALICAGAGAGLTGADLRHVRGSDVVRRHGGVVIVVADGAARVVPVLAPFHARLLDAAGFAGEGFIVGGRRPDRRNVTAGLVASVAGGSDLPRLELGRLRATWVATCATHLGLRAFFDAAGVSHSAHIADVVASLPPPEETEAVRLLGGG
jgi:hypothetical protein